MSDQGYIKLWRRSMDSEVFADPELWKLWCLCLMKASHKTQYISAEQQKKPVKVLPGQFITGRFALQIEYYWKPGQIHGMNRMIKNAKSPSTIWRWMQLLEKMGNLTIQTNSRYSLITIVNWGSYQIDSRQNAQPNEQPVNSRCTADEQPANTYKNDKNDKNRERNKQRKKVFTPPSTQEVQAYCQERSNSVDFERFVDFYQAKGWMVGKNKMKDWKAAVRSWEKNKGGNGKHQSAGDRIQQQNVAAAQAFLEGGNHAE